VIETRHEPPDGPAAVALWAEYIELVSRRAGPEFVPEERIFGTPRARGRGHARRLLAELEGLAREAGQREMRLFTTDMLPEAMALYASEGYTVRSEHPVEARTEFWLEKPL
jgi:GNAT superfamily N-acetyltransferase